MFKQFFCTVHFPWCTGLSVDRRIATRSLHSLQVSEVMPTTAGLLLDLLGHSLRAHTVFPLISFGLLQSSHPPFYFSFDLIRVPSSLRFLLDFGTSSQWMACEGPQQIGLCDVIWLSWIHRCVVLLSSLHCSNTRVMLQHLLLLLLPSWHIASKYYSTKKKTS